MTDAALDTIAVTSDSREENPWARAWRRLKRRKGAMVGLVVVVLFVLVAMFAPLIAPYDPTATSWSAVRKAPSWAHWLGTDEVGRDVLSRVIFGARASLSAGLVSVGIAVGVGVPVGLLAGYAGGCCPSPRNESAASAMMAPAIASDAWTRSGETMLGRIWRSAMRRRGLPTARAAST